MYGVLYNTLGTRCKSIHSLIYLFKLKLNGIKTLKKKILKLKLIISYKYYSSY